MITIDQYFGEFKTDHKDVTPAVYANAQRLLKFCNKLEALAMSEGVEFPINPQTHSGVAGSRYGGFRPQDCTIGAPKSAHKTGEAVDRYDPGDLIDKWLKESAAANKAIQEYDMYFEHMSATPGWSHWSIRETASGKRFFYP